MMPHNSPQLDLLDQMHSAILAADFATLAQLSPALEDSLQYIDKVQDHVLLAKIKARAERNAVCLLAAGRGVRAAQRRLNDLRNATQGFSTYDGRGKRAHHGQPTSFALRY